MTGRAMSIVDRYRVEYPGGLHPILAECEAADTVRAMDPEPRIWGHSLKPWEARAFMSMLAATGLQNDDLDAAERSALAWLAGMDSTEAMSSLLTKVRERTADQVASGT